MAEDNTGPVELLRQTRDRAQRMIAALRADLEDLRANRSISAEVKSEGEAAIADLIEHAKSLAEKCEAALQQQGDEAKSESETSS
ncbi:MAG TPA: hypothetical protein VFW23_11940 [Tepidisphaeraceae bacterium]|nr:hypothetical protein [Tepidisphaeraceae bacterium]